MAPAHPLERTQVAVPAHRLLSVRLPEPPPPPPPPPPPLPRTPARMRARLGAAVALTVLTAGQALLGCLLEALPAPGLVTPLCPWDDNTPLAASPRVSQITRPKRPYLCPSCPTVR